MTNGLSRTITAALSAMTFLLPLRAEAEVRLTRPSPKLIEIVADGSSPWHLPFHVVYAQIPPRNSFRPPRPDALRPGKCASPDRFEERAGR
jgi:hypothetical protein